MLMNVITMTKKMSKQAVTRIMQLGDEYTKENSEIVSELVRLKYVSPFTRTGALGDVTGSLNIVINPKYHSDKAESHIAEKIRNMPKLKN